MKKTPCLLIIFCMLFSPNVFAGINADNFTPKNKISDVRKIKKIKTIQKLLNTKVGKFIIKKTLKKLQKQALNPQKNKNKKSYIIMGVLVILGAIFGLLFRGIQLIISGNVSTGIILVTIGLIGAGLFVLWQVLDATGYKYR